MSPEANKKVAAELTDPADGADLEADAGRQHSPGETFAGGPPFGDGNAQRPPASKPLHNARHIGKLLTAAFLPAGRH